MFATPAMIGLMEDVAHSSVARHLGAELTTVGYEVHVHHLAPADSGQRIVVTSELTDVFRNRLTFTVEARCGEVLLGRGLHRRAVVPARS